MSQMVVLVLAGSVVVMIGELLYRAYTRTAPLAPRAVAVVAAAGIAYSLLPNASVQHMGGVDETASIVFCYLAMVLGMVAEYGYAQAEEGRKKLTFEVMPFLMPIFASPIVFIPLLTLTSELGAGGAFTRARLMIYLVAFQNGFFWKTFFEQRRKQLAAVAHHGEAATV